MSVLLEQLIGNFKTGNYKIPGLLGWSLLDELPAQGVVSVMQGRQHMKNDAIRVVYNFHEFAGQAIRNQFFGIVHPGVVTVVVAG